jgi:hypothetical protein
MKVENSIVDFLRPSTKFDTNLQLLLDVIPFLSLAQRKILITVCQTGLTTEHWKIDQEMKTAFLEPDHRARNRNKLRWTEKELYDLTVIATRTHMTRSVVLNILKTELLEDTEASWVLRESVAKEFNASQVEMKTSLSYACLDVEQFSTKPIRYCPCPLLNVDQLLYARNFVSNLITILDRAKTKIWYPHVQRKKSLSITTCENLYAAGYRGDRDYKDFRSLDLELHKVETGVEIEGENEMRQAWKFNELKPRVYYAMGGTSYWKCRYMKPFAVMLMEAGDNTSLHHRVDPERLNHEFDASEEYIVVWDLESITTKLAEAKFFLYWIAKQVKDSHLEQTPFRFLDYAEGIVEKSIGDYLLEFNEEENYEAPYLYSEMEREFDSSVSEHKVFCQRNNGMLGSMGNIGVATSFHGFHTAMGVKRCQHCSVCIGDDAAAIVITNPLDKKKGIIKHIQEIGVLHEEKAYIFEPMGEDDWESDTWKFLKRGFERNRNGVYLDYFEVFPNMLYIAGLASDDTIHSPSMKTDFEHCVSFITGVGSLLWSISSHGELDEYDTRLIARILDRCYWKLRLPRDGRLPYQYQFRNQRQIPVCIPPIDFKNYNPLYEDWAEVVWNRRLGTWFRVHLEQGITELPFFCAGLEFTATDSRLTRVLEDLNVIEKVSEMFELIQVMEGNKRRFFSFLDKGVQSVSRYVYKDNAPSWIHHLYSYSDPLFHLNQVI